MIKIEKIKVRNYKNIKEADVNFKNFNVIVGPNNSGKTSFLQLISLLNFIINGAPDEIQNSFSIDYLGTNMGRIIPYKGNDTGTLEFALRYINTITNNIFNYSIELEWQRNGERNYDRRLKIKYESLDYKNMSKPGRPINIFERNTEEIKSGAEIPKGLNKVPEFVSMITYLNIISEGEKQYKEALDCLKIILKTPTFYFSNIELSKTESKGNISSYGSRTIAYDLEAEAVKLMHSSKAEIYKEALMNVLNITDVYLYKPVNSEKNELPSKEYIYFRHFDVYKDFKLLSDGSIMLLALVTKLLNSENDILIIEEPENSIHPRALVELIRFMRSFEEEKQFIISTHSIALINEIQPEDVIIASIDEKGQSTFSRADDIKDFRKKLRQSYINFSDMLFFDQNQEETF